MFEIRKMKKDQWLILFLIGILLAVIALPVSDSKTNTGQKVTETQDTGNTAENDYEKKLEKRLETTLEKMKGVGKVTVMITLKASAEKVVEKDLEMTSEVQEGESGEKNTSSSETSVYESESGDEIPYVKQEISPQIEGVLVIAEGGDSAVVAENITEAVQALFGVDTHKIKVMKHN